MCYPRHAAFTTLLGWDVVAKEGDVIVSHDDSGPVIADRQPMGTIVAIFTHDDMIVNVRAKTTESDIVSRLNM